MTVARRTVYGLVILSFLIPIAVWSLSEVVTRDTTQSPCPAIDDTTGECRNLRYNSATKGLDINIVGVGYTRWRVNHSPTSGTRATATYAAGTGSTRRVADCISYSMFASTAPATTQIDITLRDGVSGLGTVLWQKHLVATNAIGNHANESICGLNIIGSVTTAITLEFSAGLTNEFQSVNLTGYDTQ